MRKYVMSGLALTLLIIASLLGGCSSSNKEGQPASLSTTAGAVSLDGNLQAEITGITINSPPVVTFRLLDENGMPLDPATTGLTVRFYIAQLKADGTYANYEGSVKNADGTTSGDPSYENTTTTNGKGTIASLGGGVYTYTFFRDIKDPTKTLGSLVYDATKTHTLAIQAYRNVTTVVGTTFQQAKNVYFNFRPDGQAVTQTREIVATSNCNECHGKLGLHGGSRREVALCILCHNPGLTRTGVPFDFKYLIHRIHMGEKLPGNVAALAAGGSGFSIGSSTFADVGFPFISGDAQITNRPIECTKCHRAGTDINGRAFGRDVDRWKKNSDGTKSSATMENCGTCHNTVVWDGSANVNVADATKTVNPTTGAITYTPTLTSVPAFPHTGGVQIAGSCDLCHKAELPVDNAYQMTVVGHHTVFEKSSVFTGLNYQILSVTNATPGNKPTVSFKITDDKGNVISPIATTHVAGTTGTALNDVSFSLKLGYFKQADYINDGMGNYGQPLSQATNGVAAGTLPTANGDGSYTITFATAIPALATGTGVVGMEGTRYYQIPTTAKYAARAVRAGGKAVQYYFDLATGAKATDPAKQRRVSVDADKCIACHSRLSLHGGNRVNNVQECVICHNPNGTDNGHHTFPTGVLSDGLTETPIHFKVMIHRIHTGENLDLAKQNPSGGYYVSGNNFGLVKYPRDRRDCSACHVDANPISFGLPLPLNVLGTTTATGTDLNNAVLDDNTRMLPIKSTCISCHDNQVAVDMADSRTTNGVEDCVRCHRTGLMLGPDFAHTPVR